MVLYETLEHNESKEHSPTTLPTTCTRALVLETNMPITARIGYALTAILSFKEYGGITIGPDLLAQEALLAQLARASRFHRLWSAQPIGSQPP
jgi:hypothetical protein